MKKFLVATITSILLLIGIVAGSIYYEKYKIEHIVKSDKAKTAIENMLKKMENKVNIRREEERFLPNYGNLRIEGKKRGNKVIKTLIE